MIIKIKKIINAITETKEPAYIDNSDCYFIGVDINVYEVSALYVGYRFGIFFICLI